MNLEEVRFNNQEIIKKEIQPLLRLMKDICLKNQIPMFVALAEKEDGEHMTSYYTDIVSPALLEMKLSNDKISPMLKVVNDGFDVVPAMMQDTIEMDF